MNATAASEDLVAIRRDLHAHPEIGLNTDRTADIVANVARRVGADEVHVGIGGAGVVAIIRGREADSGTAVGLRADMDALPIHEANDVGYRSRRDGVMHACGHDGHVAILLGVIEQLARHRDFAGTVVAIFQPGEEGHRGARVMLDDGLFKRFPVDAIYALHNWPSLNAGQIAVAPGPIMAARDDFWIRMSGSGGHGAQPHLALDPVVAAAQFITAVQSVVSRNVDPSRGAVVTVHSIDAGSQIRFGESTPSVTIPVSVELAGTAKWTHPDVGHLLRKRIPEIAEAIARAFSVDAETAYETFLPLTVNSSSHAELVAAVAGEIVGQKHVLQTLPPSMASEDFAFFLDHVPGAYFHLGTGGAPLHCPDFDFNDTVIPVGTALLAGIARRTLSRSGVTADGANQ
jgi:amidohydrolase